MRPATLLGPAALLLAPAAALLAPSSASSYNPWSTDSIPLVAEILIYRLSGYPIASAILPARQVSEVLGLAGAFLIKRGREGRGEGIASFIGSRNRMFPRGTGSERESEGDRSNSDRGVGLELRLLFHVVGVGVEVSGVVDGMCRSSALDAADGRLTSSRYGQQGKQSDLILAALECGAAKCQLRPMTGQSRPANEATLANSPGSRGEDGKKKDLDGVLLGSQAASADADAQV